MMTDELIKAGEAIMDSVSRAVGDGNYKRLGQELENVISDTIEAVTLDAANAAHNFNAKRRVQRPARPPFFTKLVDRDFGHEKRTGGMIGTVACTTLALANLLLWNPFAAIIFAVVDIPFIYTLRSGNQEKYLVKEFYRYGELIQSRTYITFQELADLAGEKKEMVIKNIRQMKLHDFLPTATIDHEETTLMLTNAVYREYMNSYLIRQNETIKRRQTGQEDTTQSEAKKAAQEILNENAKKVSPMAENLRTYVTIGESLPQDVKDILKEGNVYLNKIRGFNDIIPDTEHFSDQLYTLEATVLSIFKHVKEDPESVGELRRFMSYYLPTTEKLLQSYVDLYHQNGDLSNIKNSKQEIEDALDVINDAFEKMLNQLYQDKSWDISSDISVMKTMMKQDALI